MNDRYPYGTTGDLVRYDNANRASNSWGDLWNHMLSAPQGWICPRCGRVWSPSMIMCTCKPVTTITSGSALGTLEEMANDPAVQAEIRAIRDEERGMTLNEVKERYLPNRNKEDLDKPATSAGVESED